MVRLCSPQLRKTLGLATAVAFACLTAHPAGADRYAVSDALFATVASNIANDPTLEIIAEIDHSRLAADVGSNMPPARVVIFSDSVLETLMMQANPLTGIDLPLRVLSYEVTPDGDSKVTYNTFDYVSSRYGLGADPKLASQYKATMARALSDVLQSNIRHFDSDDMQPDGIITLVSDFDMETTLAKLRDAINMQDDTVWFGEVDFRARAAELGETIAPSRLLLFGGPGPGGKAMANAPTLGLDAFCQKLLVWQDSDGTVQVSFNDLLALADRQMVGKSIALRVVNRRVGKTFENALSED